MRLTDTEREALRTLDILCWEDSESGGDGWTSIEVVAREMGVSYVWAAQLLQMLRRRDLAESKHPGEDRRCLVYAPSEKGAQELLAGEVAA